MAASSPTPCPSCHSVMQVHALPGNNDQTIELDLCFHCQGMWIDPQENLKLSPAAVADLFRLLHEQRTATHQPLAPGGTAEQALREQKAQRGRLLTTDVSGGVDLWSLGLALVSSVLD